MGTVMLTQGVRKIAIHSTRRSVSGGATYGMQQTFMPLRVNYTGVMPIIFAQPVLQIPGFLARYIPSDATGAMGWLRSFFMQLATRRSPVPPTSVMRVITASRYSAVAMPGRMPGR